MEKLNDDDDDFPLSDTIFQITSTLVGFDNTNPKRLVPTLNIIASKSYIESSDTVWRELDSFGFNLEWEFWCDVISHRDLPFLALLRKLQIHIYERFFLIKDEARIKGTTENVVESSERFKRDGPIGISP